MSTLNSHLTLNESHFVLKFINGLNDELRLMVKMMRPTMVHAAVEKARLQELALEAIYRKHGLPPKSFLKSNQQIERDYNAANPIEHGFEEKSELDRPIVTKDSSKEHKLDKDIGEDHILYLQRVDEVALENEDGDADSLHATDGSQACNRDLDQRKKWEDEDLHNPTTALNVSLLVTSNGVDQLQVLALVEKEQLKLTKQENNHMLQKMMEKEATAI